MQDILWGLYFLFLRVYAKLSIVSTDQTARMYNLQGIHQDSWQDSLLLIMISMSCQTIMSILSIFTAIHNNCCLLLSACVMSWIVHWQLPHPSLLPCFYGRAAWPVVMTMAILIDPDQIRLLELFNQDL